MWHKLQEKIAFLKRVAGLLWEFQLHHGNIKPSKQMKGSKTKIKNDEGDTSLLTAFQAVKLSNVISSLVCSSLGYTCLSFKLYHIMYLSHHCRLLNLIDLCMKNISLLAQPPHRAEFLFLSFLMPVLTPAGQENSCVGEWQSGLVLRFMRSQEIWD